MWTADEAIEDMPIRKDDWPEIDKRIRQAIEPFRPHGWRKTVFLLREFGPLVAITAVFVAMLGITLGAVYQAFSHVKEETEFRTNTKNKLDKLDTDVVSLRALVSSNEPLKNQNQKSAKELLAQARQKLIPPIPSSVVEQAGKSFVEAAQEEPKAWDVALDFMAYRSLLNTSFDPTLAEAIKGLAVSNSGVVPVPRNTIWKYGDNPVKGKPLPALSMYERRHYAVVYGVPPKEAARYDLIGLDRNINAGVGPVALIKSGGAENLDDFHIRNTVFYEVEVHYSGRPVILENVTFINCTFVIDSNDEGRRLGEEVLASTGVNFKNVA